MSKPGTLAKLWSEHAKVAVIILALLVTSCVRAEVRPIKSDDVEGIRFYRPWPYLWVTLAKADEGAGCKLTVEYLPDLSQQYIIIPHYIGVGTLKVAPQLAQGWNLTALEVQADPKVAELVTAISGLAGNIASAAIKPAVEGASVPALPGPGLYRFEFNKQDGRVEKLIQVFALTGDNLQPLTCGRNNPPR